MEGCDDMFIKKNRKTGIPPEVISESRIRKAKRINIDSLLNELKNEIVEGDYIIVVAHEETFNSDFNYHQINTTICLSNEFDEEEESE